MDLDLDKAKLYWQRESWPGDQIPLAKKTILILIAEVERLKAENDALGSSAAYAQEKFKHLQDSYFKLREALKWIAGHTIVFEGSRGKALIACIRCAKEALKGK